MDPLDVLIREVSDQVLCLFFNWIPCLPEWSCVSSLYILMNKPLSDTSLAKMSSHMVGSFFIFLMFSLAIQKLFSLMKSHLFILSFIPCPMGYIGENIVEWDIWHFTAYVLL